MLLRMFMELVAYILKENLSWRKNGPKFTTKIERCAIRHSKLILHARPKISLAVVTLLSLAIHSLGVVIKSSLAFRNLLKTSLVVLHLAVVNLLSLAVFSLEVLSLAKDNLV